tara:strand:+ start:2238 stop:2945 length:708 start_codon:yes stop_codon:yes gene_type:complete
MQYTSRAIAISYIKYKESSIIAKIFTEEKGLQNFIVKGVRKKKTKKNIGLFQPLQLSNLNAKHYNKRDIQILIDINSSNNQIEKGIPIKKNFIYLFIADVISNILFLNKIEKPLFKFLWNVKIELTESEKVNSNFAILFMLKLSKYLGFYPLLTETKNTYFNLELGTFTNKKDNIGHYINKENSLILLSLLKKEPIVIKYKNRNQLLVDLMKYYKHQHHNLENVTSHIIIQSLRS